MKFRTTAVICTLFLWLFLVNVVSAQEASVKKATTEVKVEPTPSPTPTPSPELDVTIPSSICSTVPMKFVANATNVAVKSWAWNLGDGRSGSGPTLTHAYEKPGDYKLTLFAMPNSSQDYGKTATVLQITKTLHVKNTPTASFEYKVESKNTSVLFTEITTGEPAWRRWDFGDGQTNENKDPFSKDYGKPGCYVVKLTVGNECGTSTSQAIPVCVGGVSQNCSCDGDSAKMIDCALRGGDLAAKIECAKSIEAEVEKSEEEDRTIPDKCQKNLRKVQQAIRDETAQNREDLTKLQKKLLNPELSPDERKKTVDAAAAIEEKIKSALSATELPADEPLYQGYDDYERLFAKFATGYEFVNTSDIAQKGFPRFGFLVQIRYGGWTISTKKYGFSHKYGFQHSLTALIANSAETSGVASSLDTTNSKATTEAASEAKIDRAITFEKQLYWPFLRTKPLNKRGLRSYFGLLFVTGAKKIDNHDHVDGRYYVGFRASIGPEQWADFLWGRTDGLKSDRLEIRGQLPVNRFANGSRIFLGAVGNFGITKEKKGRLEKVTIDNKEVEQRVGVERDVIQVYLTWNVDFREVWSNLSGKD